MRYSLHGLTRDNRDNRYKDSLKSVSGKQVVIQAPIRGAEHHSPLCIAVLSICILAACSKDKKTTNPTPQADDTEIQFSVSSTFDIDDEGWLIAGDAQGDSGMPTYVPETESESAHIAADDNVSGGTWYFQAPDKFLGNRLNLYNGTLTFELKVTESNGFDRPDVVFLSGDSTISTQLPSIPVENFTSYSITLNELGWVDSGGVEIDVNTFSQVLENLEGLRIRGEYNVGADTGALDNVVLSFGK